MTTAWVVQHAKHVKISLPALNIVAQEIAVNPDRHWPSCADWSTWPCHLRLSEALQACNGDKMEAEELLARYVLVVDTINFCFWPEESTMEYEDLVA